MAQQQIVEMQDGSTWEFDPSDMQYHCMHINVEIEYDSGGDGITEPGPSWSVYCNDCSNQNMTDHEVDLILQNHWDREEDYDEER